MAKNTAVAVLETPQTIHAETKGTDYEVLYEELKSNYVSAMGKSVGGYLAIAKTIAEARKMLGAVSSLENHSYGSWLRNVAKMSRATGLKYISIDDAFGEMGSLKQFTDRLPINWTSAYEISKIASAESLTPAKARQAAEKALKFINTPDKEGVFPTVSVIAEFVSVLCGAEPKRKDDTVTEPKPALPPGVPDEVTRHYVGNQNTNPLGGAETKTEEPTPEQIEEAIAADQNTLFADDDNDVTLAFEASFNALRQMRLKNKIMALLHEENFVGLEVIVRQKGEVA